MAKSGKMWKNPAKNGKIRLFLAIFGKNSFSRYSLWYSRRQTKKYQTIQTPSKTQ